MIKLSLLTLLLIYCSIVTFAQEHEDYIPQVIPPSPEAASLGKYADIPIGKYTGIPNINIPLYEIKSRDITVPISLSYHASGVKVEEEASWVGMGWSLNAGGVITRSVRGNDDFLQGVNDTGYLYSIPVPADTTDPNFNGNYLVSLCNGDNDSQQDIFYYNFLGSSGKFLLKQKDSPTDTIEVVFLSPGKTKIEYDETNGIWTLWNQDGYKFTFGTKEYTRNISVPQSSGQFNQIPLNPPPDQLTGDPTVPNIITAWYLDQVRSPTGETVTFEYQETIDPVTGNFRYGTGSVVSLNESSKWVVDYQGIPYNADPGCKSGSTYWFTQTLVHNVYLERILFQDGFWEVIIHTIDRSDLRPYIDPINETYLTPQMLDKIEVKDKQKTIRNFNFAHSYFNPLGDYKLKRLRA